MSAIIEIREYHGTNLVSSSVVSTSSAFRSSDTSAAYTGFPIPVPDDGSAKYSYDLPIRLVITQAPDNSISNIRFWKDYEVITGCKFYVDSVAAVFTPADTGTAHAGSDLDNYYDIGHTYNWDIAANLTSGGDQSKILDLIMSVNSAASQGSDNILAHYAYDES